MNFGMKIGNDLRQLTQEITTKYSSLSKKIDEPPSFTSIEQNEKYIRNIVDEFARDMTKLKIKLSAKGKTLQAGQHKELEFIAKQFDEVSGVGRGGGELFAAKTAMTEIFNAFHFDQSSRMW